MSVTHQIFKKITVIVLENNKTVFPLIIRYFETVDEKESLFWKDNETKIYERKSNSIKQIKHIIKKILCL